MQNIIDWITSVPGNLKDFVIENNTNPLLWIGLFFGGVLVFFLTYNALNKNK